MAGVVFGIILIVVLWRMLADALAGPKKTGMRHQHLGLADSRAASGDDRTLVRHDLEPLNTVQSNLADDTLRYVFEGDRDSVLLKLRQNADKAAKAMDSRPYAIWRSGRHDFLLGAATWRPQAVRRYAEVLAIIYPARSWDRLPGSDQAPLWLRNLIQTYNTGRSALANKHFRWSVRPNPRASTAWTIEQLKSLVPDDLGSIVDVAFVNDQSPSVYYGYGAAVGRLTEAMTGFRAFMDEDPTARADEIRRLPAKGRAHALQYLAKSGLTSGAWFDLAFGQIGDTAKTVREAAAVLLRESPPELLTSRVRETWSGLKSGQKTALAALLAASPLGRDVLRELAEKETNATVLADLTRRLDEGGLVVSGVAGSASADGPDGFTDLTGTWIETPPAPEVPLDTPVSQEAADLIRQAIDAWRSEAEAHNRDKAGQRHHYRRQVPPGGAAQDLIETMNGTRRVTQFPNVWQTLMNDWQMSPERQALRDQILRRPDVTIWHLVRPMNWGERGWNRMVDSVFFFDALGEAVRTRLGPTRDLRVFSLVIEALGQPRNALATKMLGNRYHRPSLDDWADDQIWPYLLGNLDLLDTALGLRPRGDTERGEIAAMMLLERFPGTPGRYMQVLLDLALGETKSLRVPARNLLARTPGLTGLLHPLLRHPRGEVRATTARWLGDIGDASTQAVALDAARKESLPAVKAAILATLARLGGDISEFLSPDALAVEARAGLKKASLKGLDWIPFDGLPSVRLRGGRAVGPDVVKWWVVLAIKLKQPGGNPWSELLLDELEPTDAEKLGLALLQAFIVQDTLAPGDDDANAYANAHVDARLAQYQTWNINYSRDQIFAQLRREKLTSYYGSANDQKGMLALATRAPGADAAAAVRSYLRDHYVRTAQCKALIECLASNPSPLATQYVLAVSKRWRTRGVKDLAAQLVEAIAERNGWTPDQLADRTAPTGGFDERGLLDLPVGEKSYQARLDFDGRIGLYNPDGKPVKSLPASASGPAAEDLTEAKQALSTARKETKQVWDAQSRRLQEALSTQREWASEDWIDHILNHPVMTRMAQRLIWQGRRSDDTWIAFRPMDDLSLTDAADAEVAPDAFSVVRLAHSSQMDPGQIGAWKTHLADYEVVPLFVQIDRPLRHGDPKQTEVTDREGWGIESFKLRSAATKLGYNRGAAEDGGWFMTYEKPFDSLKLTVVIEFTGAPLPEENEPTALIAMRIVRQRPGRYLDWSKGVPFGEVPPVLVSEAWSDLHTIAAAGTGANEDWKKRFHR